MKEYYKPNSHISSKLLMIYISSNDDGHFFTKTFTSLHYTCRHFNFSNFNFTQLHFTPLHYTCQHFNFSHFNVTQLHFTPLHYTCQHFNFFHFNFTQLHFTPLHYTCQHFNFSHFNFTQLHFSTLLQGEQASKGHEVLQLRGQTRDLKAELERQETEMDILRQQMKARDEELVRLQRLTTELEETNLDSQRHQQDADNQVLRLKADVSRLKDQLVEVGSANKLKLQASELQVGKLRGDMLQMEKTLRAAQEVTKCSIDLCNCKTHQPETETLQQDADLIESGMKSNLRNGDVCWGKAVERLRDEISEERREFEQERVTWAQEKEKVLRYQRQLQLNYVQMFRRTKTLEAEVESLTLELELETKTGRATINHTAKNQLPAIDMGHTIEL